MAQHTGSDGPLGPGFEEMIKSNTHNMETLAKSYEVVFDKVGKVNEETMEFWARRLKEDFKMPSKLAHCHAPEEFAEAYSQFLSKMFSDYNEQAGRVAELMGEVVGEGLFLAQNGKSERAKKEPARKDKTSS